MEIYNVYRRGNAGKNLIQGSEANSNLTGPTPFLERVGTMYNEGAANYSVDQGLYYPTATNFGYYCTGFESPGEWEDRSRIFGVDGPEIQHAVVQTENSPYVHYTPSYGYAESPYNPYNPFIPGAMMGADGSYVDAQQCYPISPYQDAVSSPGYLSVVLPPDVLVNGSSDSLLGSGVAFSSGHEGRNLKHGFVSSSSVFPRTPLKAASSRINSFSRTSEGARSNVRSAKQLVSQGDVSSGSFVTPASQHMLQGRHTSGSVQSIADISRGNMRSNHNQLKVGVPVHNSFSDFQPSVRGWTSVGKLESNIHDVRTPNDVRGGSDAMSEQNRRPRVDSSRNKLAAKPYSDHYDKVDFPVDYAFAKFFVIKSYSEDDVHKSIKYNVWSSTSHGNKKLQGAYEDAQKLAAGKPGCCPIFLFFSVNASGQFCGIAEMIGPVDFHKDMDFWQQDKWNGSFCVKWHIIKDVPNSSFRHIILENNENKPVTSSRDTQEIMYKQGMEMLKTFKSHPSRTSIFDDFVYYEDRQTVLQKERARLMSKSFGTQFLAPTLCPTEKPNCLVELPLTGNEKVTDENVPDELKKTEASAAEQVSSNSDITKSTSTTSESSYQTRVKVDDDSAPDLAIGSLSINLKQDESNLLPDAAGSVSSRVPVDIVTVGSMPVRVNRNAESCRFLTVGSIPLDPRALQLEKVGALAKHG